MPDASTPRLAGLPAQGPKRTPVALGSFAETAPLRPDGSSIAADVHLGLTAARKRLPPRLFYDRRGSELFEAITRLPEYYLTRTEQRLLEQHGDTILGLASPTPDLGLEVIELGAGSATKTRILLSAAIRRQGRTTYVPIDVSEAALTDCTLGLGRALPLVDIRPLPMRHEAGLSRLANGGKHRLVLFIGSSIGNLEDTEAVALLAAVRRCLGPDGRLLLGADRPKPLSVMLAAYDDRAGVTAEFNRNVLVRINRELGGHFEPRRFDHRAVWNGHASAIEMHLVSQGAQRVAIDALELEVQFADGETIHTESSIKYDDARIDAIVRDAGLAPDHRFFDDGGWFGLHLCRPT